MRGNTLPKLLLLAAFAVALSAGAANAAGDAEKGKKTIKKCFACHSLEEGKKKVGPSLHNVIGRKAGSETYFKYSKSYPAAGEKGLEWNAETLLGYLENPKKFMREYLGDKKARSKMVLKMKKLSDRENVIAYLESLQPAE